MKITCKKCKVEVKEISVLKTMEFRADFRKTTYEIFHEVDKEYYLGEVKRLIYKCHCYPNGKTIERDSHDSIQDFVRDSEYLLSHDIKQATYGDLIIEQT